MVGACLQLSLGVSWHQASDMIDNSQQLGAFLRAEAHRWGLMLGVDTHYEAGNWVLSWWNGRHRHRLDFQPIGDRGLAITHYADHVPWIPGAVAKLLDALGPFSDLARTEWTALEKAHFPIEEQRVQSHIADCLASSSTADRAKAQSNAPTP